MSDVLVESLREKRARAVREADAAREIVKQSDARLAEDLKALEKYTAQVDSIDAEIREAKGS